MGTYKIRLYCDGFYLDTEWIDVLSSVDQAKFITSSQTQFNFSSINDFESNFHPLLTVLNENN